MATLLASPTWAEDEEVAVPTAIYYAIPEPFTINFLNQSNQQARYLQIKVTLKSTNAEAIESAEQNLPMIQDALLDLFSDQSYTEANSVDGRKALQQNTLETVKTILKEETGNDAIDAIYFTSFILQ
jgi:flagellar FliL protein